MDFHTLPRKSLQFLCKKNGIPANLTNVAMANSLQALETVEGIQEIQETLCLQSPKRAEVKSSPNLSRSVRVSARRAARDDEPKIQQRTPFTRLRTDSTKDLDVTLMASKEKEGKKEPLKVYPNTPAMKKTGKVVEARSSRARAKKEDEVEEVNLSETPMVVELKKGKAVGVVTRRSTRLSSRKPVEEITTVQSISRRSSKEKAVVNKMGSLCREEEDEQEYEEKKNDLAAKNDLPVDLLDEEDVKKDQEVEIHDLSSPLDVGNPKFEVDGFSQSTEESHQLPANVSMEDSGNQMPENELIKNSGDMLAGNDEPVKDYSPDKMYFEVSDELVPGNLIMENSMDPSSEKKTLQDSLHQSSDDKPTIHADSDEFMPFGTLQSPQEGKGSCFVEVEEEKLSLFFTELTLETRDKSGNETSKAVASEMVNSENEASRIEAIAKSPVQVENDLTRANEFKDMIQKTEVFKGVTFEPQLLDSTKFLVRDSSIETPNESIEEDLQKFGEPVNNETVNFEDIQTPSCNELQIPVSSAAVLEETRSDVPREISDVSVEDEFRNGDRNSGELAAIDAQKENSLVSSTEELRSELSTADSSTEITIVSDKSADDKPEIELANDEPVNVIGFPVENDFHDASKLDVPEFLDMGPELASYNLQVSPFPAELGVEFAVAPFPETLQDITESEAINIVSCAPEKLSGESTELRITEIVEVKEETKAVEKNTLKEKKFELLSLGQLRALYKQKLENSKNVPEMKNYKIKQEPEFCSPIKQKFNDDNQLEVKKSVIKQEDLACRSASKLDSSSKQKLNDYKLEIKKFLIKQEDLAYLSGSKLDSSNKHKLNDSKINIEKKRTPLKNLN